MRGGAAIATRAAQASSPAAAEYRRHKQPPKELRRTGSIIIRIEVRAETIRRYEDMKI